MLVVVVVGFLGFLAAVLWRSLSAVTAAVVVGVADVERNEDVKQFFWGCEKNRKKERTKKTEKVLGFFCVQKTIFL